MRSRLYTLFVILGLACAFLAKVSVASAVHHRASDSLSLVLKNVMPAIVNIVAERNPIAGFEHSFVLPDRKALPPSVSIGSGVIVHSSERSGFIVTNAHVINRAKLMIITLKDGRRYHAHLIGEDDDFDIAVLRIDADHLTALSFGDSDQLKVGDSVAAIGSPFGLMQSVTSGVISALNRSEPRIEGYQSFIQTDAQINPGNSGGALVNLEGQLVGINTAIISPSYGSIGIGFAIPSNIVQSLVQQLIKYGKVERGMLGVVAQNLSPVLVHAMNLKVDQGVIVTQVFPGSAADQAGIRVKDVILKVDSKPVYSADQLRNLLGMMRPGTPLTLLITRQDVKKRIKALVGDPKQKRPQQKRIPFLMGMSLQDFSGLEADGIHLQGALVTHVSSTSQGMLAGLMPGDVITSVNGQSVASVKSLEEYVRPLKAPLFVSVKRATRRLFLVIQP